MTIDPTINLSEISSILLNQTNFVKSFPPEISSSILGLITLIKTIGIIFLVYLLFLIVRSIFNVIRNRRIKIIYEKVIEMDKKLDVLIDKQKKHKKKD
jgi:hypothetical protein